ncbi:MAG: hypothetical protein LQ337_000217 [Flavoplaca oasis]|nr:MAG: hypothetical protein LQ337_000217 [Flavoplaca oasis]
MPFDSFNCGTGTEVLYPHNIMNSHFSEPEWTSSNPVLLGPDDYETSYPAPRIPPPIEVSPLPGHVVSAPRPKSSPSTFGPNVEDLLFPENPFRLKSDEYMPPMYSMAPLQTSNAPATSLYGADYGLSTTTMSPIRSGPIPIAPDPIGLRQMNALKRMREEEDYSDFNQKRRKRAPSQTGPVELNDEEQLLLKLKEEENLPWKDIAVRFQTDLGKSYQVPALQMRFKRLRERMRTWTETDVQALEQAYDYWEKFQFDIIAAKMLDFGASERWPAKYCARKWDEIHPGRLPFNAQSHFLQDPWDTGHCSPVDSMSHHSLSHSPRPQHTL